MSLRMLEAFESVRNFFGLISCRMCMSVKFPEEAVPVVTAGEMGGSDCPRPRSGCRPWSLLLFLDMLLTKRCLPPLAPLTLRLPLPLPLPLPLLETGREVIVGANARRGTLFDILLVCSRFLVGQFGCLAVCDYPKACGHLQIQE